MTLSVPEQIWEDLVLFRLLLGFDAAAYLAQSIGSPVLSECFQAYMNVFGRLS